MPRQDVNRLTPNIKRTEKTDSLHTKQFYAWKFNVRTKDANSDIQNHVCTVQCKMRLSCIYKHNKYNNLNPRTNLKTKKFSVLYLYI